MENIIRTISLHKDIDQIVKNISTNFFNGNYSLSLETIIKSADKNNIELFNGNKSMYFKSLKQTPNFSNTIDLKNVPYNGSDRKFKTNCRNNFSISI